MTTHPGDAWSDDLADVGIVGREDELARLGALVDDPAVHVVQVVGESGVGKSRLARHLLDTLAAAATTRGTAPERVVLLDDAHELDLADRGRRIGSLGALGATVLVTDRREIVGPGAVTVAIGPLTVPVDYSLLDVETFLRVPAVALLVALRRTVQPSFVVDASTQRDTARLCAYLRGVPLHLRLAARLLTAVDADLVTSPAAVRDTTVLSLLARHAAALGLPPAAEVAARLSPDARLVLAAATCAAGGIGPDALAAMTGVAGSSLAVAVDELAAHGLLVGTEATSAGATGVVRTRFHLPLSALPVAAAATEGVDVAALRTAHADHHLEVATRALLAIDGHDQAQGLAMLQAEWGNVATALADLRDHDPDRAVDAVRALRPYWRALGLVFDVQEQLELLTSREAALDPQHRALLDLALADAEARLGEPEFAAESLHRARTTPGAEPDPAELAATSAVVDLTAGRAGGETALLAAAALLRDAGRTADADRAVLTAGLAALFDGRTADAAAACVRVLPDARRRGDHLTSGAALMRLAACRAAEGDLAGAGEYWSRALVHLRGLGFAVTLGALAEIVGSCLERHGAVRAARVTTLLGAMSHERGALPTVTDEPILIVGAYEERMRAELGLAAATTAWQHGRSLTPLEVLTEFAHDVAHPAVAASSAAAVVESRAEPDPVVHTGPAPAADPVRPAPRDARFAVWEDLTPREGQVALLVADGLSNRQAARELGISEWTVVNHMRAVLKKLDLHSRVHLARWAAELAADESAAQLRDATPPRAAGTDVTSVPAGDTV